MSKINELTAGKGMTVVRNAISAEKTETFIAPRLRQQLGRKPVIVMVWGKAHYGVKSMLKNPEKRKRILTQRH